MRLTLHTDYALRALMYVAMKGEALATIDEIAAIFAISKGHLMKVVNRLARMGYLETVRGKKGGIRLGQSSAEINVAAVVRDMEEELGVLGCLQGRGYCRIKGCCVLRTALREATDAFLAVLGRLTLEDLLRPRHPLQHLLRIEGRALPKPPRRALARG